MFGPPQRFTAASTCSWLGHPVSGLRRYTYLALFRLAFAATSRLYRLISHNIVTRRPVLQKVRYHSPCGLLYLLVSIRFQVLFHSPPGVLFTFPSRYYTLSVTWSYLAFGDGPPFFRQDSSCPDVLRLRLAIVILRIRGCYPLRPVFPNRSAELSSLFAVPKPLTYFYIKFGLFRFRSPLLSESIFLSFPPGN